jgi:hypothetical protein
MSNIPSTPDTAKKADDAMARFEARMADHEEQTRPKRTRDEVLDEAIAAVKLQLQGEQAKLEGRFTMAAQEQAQREIVRDLDWLVEDLKDLRLGKI